MIRKLSLLRADPILFSPIYLNTDNVSTDNLLAFYRFANLFFPSLGSGLLNTLLDMERHSERLLAPCSPAESTELIRKMQNLSVNIQFTVTDDGESVMEISLRIIPSEVLKRVRQGRNDLIQYQDLSDGLDKMIAKLLIKEINRRFTARIAYSFKALAGIAQVPSFIAQLLDMGWINRSGQLLPGASIDDLLIGKYREQFEQLMPREILQEGLQIRETIETCFAIRPDDADSLMCDAKARHALLEITIRETRTH